MIVSVKVRLTVGGEAVAENGHWTSSDPDVARFLSREFPIEEVVDPDAGVVLYSASLAMDAAQRAEDYGAVTIVEVQRTSDPEGVVF